MARKTPGKTPPDVSRRSFISNAMASATAAAALVRTPVSAASLADEVGNHAIRIPDEFAKAVSVTPAKAEFPMTGAQVFARVCKEEGLAALFCCPGNYNVVNAIALEGVPTLRGVTKVQCATPPTRLRVSPVKSRPHQERKVPALRT